MECPRCGEQLTKEEHEGHNIDVCRSCGGMWLHRDQLNSLLGEHDSPEDNHPVITCRECKTTTMKKIHFMDYSDVIIDYCPRCGAFWLDKGELEKMNEYVKKVEEGTHDVRFASAYNFLVRLSELSYSIFH